MLPVCPKTQMSANKEKMIWPPLAAPNILPLLQNTTSTLRTEPLGLFPGSSIHTRLCSAASTHQCNTQQPDGSAGKTCVTAFAWRFVSTQHPPQRRCTFKPFKTSARCILYISTAHKMSAWSQPQSVDS